MPYNLAIPSDMLSATTCRVHTLTHPAATATILLLLLLL